MKNTFITVIFAATILIAGSSSSVAQTQERAIVTKANSIMLPAQLMTPEQVEISSLKKANATLTQKNTELEQRIANLDGKNWEYMTEISPLGRILVQTHLNFQAEYGWEFVSATLDPNDINKNAYVVFKRRKQ